MTAEEDGAPAEIALLAARLRDLRTARGWTQDELARRAGLSKSYLSRIEDGDRQPSLASLLSLSQAFEVALAALFAVPAKPGRTHCVSCFARGTCAIRRATG